jgi:hypothetical protein
LGQLDNAAESQAASVANLPAAATAMRATALQSGTLVKVVEQTTDGVVILAAQHGDEVIEVIATVERQGDTLVLRQAHIQGSSPGAVGVRQLFAFARDFGKANDAAYVRIDGALRSTGPIHTRLTRPRPITIKVEP